MKKSDDLIIVRGAGELASGAIRRLVLAGFSVIALEIPKPLCVRRTVSFASAVFDGEAQIEGVTGICFENSDDAFLAARDGVAGIVIDPAGDSIGKFSPKIVIDARMMKNNPDTSSKMAETVIALGPGYTAPEDARYVIETSRGHDLGRVITEGSALPNTGVPGEVGGETAKRVLRAPADGEFKSLVQLGEMVSEGEPVGEVSGQNVTAEISGLLRGLIHDGVRIKKGTKIGDIDPRGNPDYLRTISDKANAIAGGVMEAVMRGSG